jgi:hypothetical protein
MLWCERPLVPAERLNKLVKAFRNPSDPVSPLGEWWRTLVRCDSIPYFNQDFQGTVSYVLDRMMAHSGFGTVLSYAVVKALHGWPTRARGEPPECVDFSRAATACVFSSLVRMQVRALKKQAKNYIADDINVIDNYDLVKPFLGIAGDKGTYSSVHLVGWRNGVSNEIRYWVKAETPKRCLIKVEDLATFYRDHVGLYGLINGLDDSAGELLIRWLTHVDEDEAKQCVRYRVARKVRKVLHSKGADAMSPTGAAISVACHMCIQADEDALTQHQEEHL